MVGDLDTASQLQEIEQLVTETLLFVFCTEEERHVQSGSLGGHFCEGSEECEGIYWSLMVKRYAECSQSLSSPQ